MQAHRLRRVRTDMSNRGCVYVCVCVFIRMTTNIEFQKFILRIGAPASNNTRYGHLCN
jgi:hypothetical protein